MISHFVKCYDSEQYLKNLFYDDALILVIFLPDTNYTACHRRMKISVNFIRQSAIFEVEQSTLISDLKLKIYEKLLVLTSMQSLTYCGHEMRNDLTLSDYDVHDNAVIDLNLKKHVTTSFVRKSVSIGESIPNANTQQQKILNGRHESEPNGVNVPTKSITRRIETAAAVRSQSDMSTDYDPTVHRPIMKVRFNDSNPSISGYYDDSQGYSRGSQEITQEDSEYFEESSRPVDFADVYNISHLITFSGENPLVRLDQAARDADSSSSSLFKNSETTAVPTSVLVPASGSGMASTRAPIAATVAASIRAHALSPPRSTAGKVGISPRRPAPSQSSSASPSSAQPPAPTTSTKSKHSIPTPKKDLLSLRTHYSQLLSDAPATVLQRQPVPTDDDSDFKVAKLITLIIQVEIISCIVLSIVVELLLSLLFFLYSSDMIGSTWT